MVAAERSLKISRQANKFIISLPEKQRKAVKESVSRLIAEGFADLDIRRLLPYPHEFRLRVGKVRILFRYADDEIFIFKAHYRGSVYKT